jgi:hypothetical protein
MKFINCCYKQIFFNIFFFFLFRNRNNFTSFILSETTTKKMEINFLYSFSLFYFQNLILYTFNVAQRLDTEYNCRKSNANNIRYSRGSPGGFKLECEFKFENYKLVNGNNIIQKNFPTDDANKLKKINWTRNGAEVEYSLNYKVTTSIFPKIQRNIHESVRKVTSVFIAKTAIEDDFTTFTCTHMIANAQCTFHVCKGNIWLYF